MSEVVELAAQLRENFGTGAARALRMENRVPAIVYGAGEAPMAISLEEKEITKLYRKPGFISTVIQIEIGSTKYKILPKAIELHPIKEIVRHVDFVFLDKKTQKMEVPIVYEGKERALGVKRGGFFNIIKRTVTMFCDVNNIPKNITIDVTNVPIGSSIKSSAITLPEGCQFVRKDDFIVATIIGRKGTKVEGEEGAAAS